MKINTRKFGEVEVDEAKVINMSDGLPGFESYKRFILLEDAKYKPFCWFQSVEEPNLALVVMDPFIFKPDYRLDFKQVIEMKDWKDLDEKDLAIFVVVNVSASGKEKRITANLIGPLVVNPRTNEAVQAVFADAPYSHQHNIMEEH